MSTKAFDRATALDVEFVLGQLRHLYRQMVRGHVSDPERAAKGLLSPAIVKLETVHARLSGLSGSPRADAPKSANPPTGKPE